MFIDVFIGFVFPTSVGVFLLQSVLGIPAQKEGFDDCFLGKKCWYAIRISSGMLERIKYIAAYQTAPVSAITHYSEVDSIEPYGDTGKYKLNFKGDPQAIKPIPYGDATKGSMQGIRYTHLTNILTTKWLRYWKNC